MTKEVTYKDKDLKHGEVCQFCRREQVDAGGWCAWCANDEAERELFEAELNSDNPNFEGLWKVGEQFI